jgi:hypothetical protein
MLRARYVVIVAAALWVTAPTAVAEPPAPPSPIVPAPVQPANIGDLKAEAKRYYDSGAYLTDLQSAAWPAIPWIAERTASTVISPTMDVYNTAKDRGAAIFFITGRPESQRAATERNLADVGYAGYTRLIMEPDGTHHDSAADFKAPQRQEIEQEGYTIVANMGDQPSDLEGGFAERTFLLPNPFYRIP